MIRTYFERKTPYIDINNYKFDKDIVKIIPKSMAKKYRLIVLEKFLDLLTVAIEKEKIIGINNKRKMSNIIKKRLKLNPVFLSAKKDDIKRVINDYY